VANIVIVFAEQVKQIIHGNTFDTIFGVGENSMWSSSEVMGFEFFHTLQTKIKGKKT